MGDPVAWVDGELRPLDEAVLRADDGAFTSGLGCYTTARVCAGKIRHGRLAADRLVRDARALEIGELEPDRVIEGIRSLARAWFGERGEGIVRMQASRDGSGRLRLVGLARDVGDEPGEWRAILSGIPHPGPQGAAGAKLSGRPALALAAAEARERGAEEALLFDLHGRLVEGTRSNLIVVGADGVAAIPARSLGAVAGVAQQIVCEELEPAEREISREMLARAHEVVAINSVRGARPVVAIDGRPVGEGAAGPWAARLAALLDAAA